MKRSLFAILIGTGLLLSACEPAATNTQAPVEVDGNLAESSASNPYEIELVGGKKWEVEAHMMSFIREMESQVKSFDAAKAGNDVLLADNLHVGIDSLTSKCVMEGQAHEELHKWLLPYIDLVDVYAASAGTESAKTDFKEIEKSFAEFNNYFE